LSRLIAEKAGLTTVEYALLAALIAIATSAGVSLASPSIIAVLKASAEAAPTD
jgi:Flp pilus assembly pilin Flp